MAQAAHLPLPVLQQLAPNELYPICQPTGQLGTVRSGSPSVPYWLIRAAGFLEVRFTGYHSAEQMMQAFALHFEYNTTPDYPLALVNAYDLLGFMEEAMVQFEELTSQAGMQQLQFKLAVVLPTSLLARQQVRTINRFASRMTEKMIETTTRAAAINALLGTLP